MHEMIKIWREMPREEKIGGLIVTVAVVAGIFAFAVLSAAF